MSNAFETGLAIRKRVLGEKYVERTLADADGFGSEFQELMTEVAWGSVWTRPGLSLRDRSLLTLAILTSLGKTAEIRIHLRGAIRNGCTAEEIREVFIHSFIYCGGPAAVEAFKAAGESLDWLQSSEDQKEA
jgi:4-carboxymuconolactone decarboxylase